MANHSLVTDNFSNAIHLNKNVYGFYSHGLWPFSVRWYMCCALWHGESPWRQQYAHVMTVNFLLLLLLLLGALVPAKHFCLWIDDMSRVCVVYVLQPARHKAKHVFCIAFQMWLTKRWWQLWTRFYCYCKIWNAKCWVTNDVCPFDRKWWSAHIKSIACKQFIICASANEPPQDAGRSTGGNIEKSNDCVPNWVSFV